MRRWGAALAAMVTLVLVAAALPAHAGAEVRWLCSAQMTDDPCDGPLTTTVQSADGTSRVVTPKQPARPPVDCFYVYPTVSNQPGPNATQTADPEVVSIARQQAARFSQRCRVFVPLYRQNTVPGIFAGGFTEATRAVAYADVKEAFERYLAQDNGGRGIVLLGHSQGAGILRRLVADTVDRDAALRKRLVAAYLLGGNVTVKAGSDRGGDFERTPLCTQAGQTGCVVAYSTFNDVPPDDTRFGRVPAEDRLTGKPAKPGTEVACTNPASLFANAERPLHPVVRSEPFAPGLIAVGITQLYGGPAPTAETPYLVPPDRYVARCVRANDAHVLLVRGVDGARVLHPSPDPTWGLHLVDMTLPLGDLVDLLGSQTKAFLKPDVKLSTATRFDRRGACSGRHVVVRVGGAIRGFTAGVRGRRAVRIGAAPFRTRLQLRRGRTNVVRVAVRGTDGRTRTVTRRLRACG